jgi:hypothetical protein
MTKSAEQIITDANRISAFLADPVIAAVLTRMERRNYEDLQDADNSEKRVVVHVKAKVLREFETELKSCLDAGEMEVLKSTKKS